MKSENWGGWASMTGSLITVAAGDAQSFISTVSFVGAEICFVRKGHTSWGYSLGCAGLSFGDGMLCFSDATSGGTALKITLIALTIAWAIGALRYPLERLGKAIASRSQRWSDQLQRTANAIPPFAGSVTLLLRIPTLYTAAFSGEHFNAVVFVCTAFWATADVLLGRVQNFIQGPFRSFLRRIHAA